MSLTNSLLPKSYMLDEAHSNLTLTQHDIQQDFKDMVGLISGAYDVDTLGEESLLALLKSFSLYDVYLALPAYYHGALVNDLGVSYSNTLPGGKVGFLRLFLVEMLKLRRDMGIAKMFDKILGMLGVTDDKFVVIQNFWLHTEGVNPVPGVDTVIPRVIYYRNAPQFMIDGIGVAPKYDKFFPSGGLMWTPTNTITVDLLEGFDSSMGDVFVVAVRTIVTFLKPVHVVFQDILPAIYLTTGGKFGHYGMSMISRGDFVEPITTGILKPPEGAPDFRIQITDDVTVTAATRTFTFASGTVITDGFVPGMLVSFTGFTNDENNVSFARIEDVTDDTIILVTADGSDLVDETGTGITADGDFDHSVQDGLIPDGSADEPGTIKPHIVLESNTRHPVMYQPGPVATLYSLGSHNKGSASARTDYLDTTHYNGLNSRVGGHIYAEDVVVQNDSKNYEHLGAGFIQTDLVLAEGVTYDIVMILKGMYNIGGERTIYEDGVGWSYYDSFGESSGTPATIATFRFALTRTGASVAATADPTNSTAELGIVSVNVDDVVYLGIDVPGILVVCSLKASLEFTFSIDGGKLKISGGEITEVVQPYESNVLYFDHDSDPNPGGDYGKIKSDVSNGLYTIVEMALYEQ